MIDILSNDDGVIHPTRKVFFFLQGHPTPLENGDQVL